MTARGVSQEICAKNTHKGVLFRILLGIRLGTIAAEGPRARKAFKSLQEQQLLAEGPHYPFPPQAAR